MERVVLATVLAVSAVATAVVPAYASDCARTATGLVPLPELGAASYKGEQGGLYPGGTNTPPRPYAAEGALAAERIVPRDADGRPDPDGRIVLLSIGMSNTTQEFSTFVRLAAGDPARDAHVLVVDGAQGGRDARDWSDPGASTWSVAETRLRAAGATAAQVQAIWMKQAHKSPRGDMASTVAALEHDLTAVVANAAARYPNLTQVFTSPRTYGGYASTTLNPEPYAYESAFAVKRLVARSVASPAARPWIGWGPYLWADGATPNASGLKWACADFVADGTHPSESGRLKVATELGRFFGTSPFTAWYRGEQPAVATAEPAEDVTLTEFIEGGGDGTAFWAVIGVASALAFAVVAVVRIRRRA